MRSNYYYENKGVQMAAVPEDIGCSNEQCVEAPNCQRTVIYENGTAREVKSFGGTPEKGCGKFLPKKEEK
jgi:hypothetical protein